MPRSRSARLPVTSPHRIRPAQALTASRDDSWLLPKASPTPPMPDGPGVAFVGVVVAQVGEVGAAALGGGDVADQQFDHGAPLVLGGPGRVAQRDLGRGADPVAVVEVVVVHLLDREELVRVGRPPCPAACRAGSSCLALAAEPELHALLGQRQQLVARLVVALLLGYRRHLRQRASGPCPAQ